jgi:hypothetical protein
MHAVMQKSVHVILTNLLAILYIYFLLVSRQLLYGYGGCWLVTFTYVYVPNYACTGTVRLGRPRAAFKCRNAMEARYW